jgi:hypothetical protein
MAQVYIHPTQRTPAQIAALQAATGRVAVFSRQGSGLLIAPPAQRPARRAHEHRLDATAYLRGPIRTQQRLPATGFDPDFPPGAA